MSPLFPLRAIRALALFFVLAGALLPAASAGAQPLNRIRYNGQELFLSGGNVAWINFARDVGPGQTNVEAFRDVFEQTHAAGGNAMRLWLHTSGTSTPQWSATTVGAVDGPGAGTIDDLRGIMDLAAESQIGLVLCLWSFDMLNASTGQTNVDRSYALLTDSANTQTYIANALVPMVTAVAGHPALLAWEIFNEPEGMTLEFGFGSVQRRIAMADVQRFVNRTAGAIHRTDPAALVTNGTVSLRQLTDVQRTGGSNYNYYTDERLIAAGGDAQGTLDFYTSHYYTNQGTTVSPFNEDYATWELTKPLAIAEFFLPDQTNGVPYQSLYATLYDRGYAGALAWQYYDFYAGREPERINWPRALENMRAMFAQHRPEVDVITAGPDIIALTTDAAQIDAGTQTTLRWEVVQAATVTLDGEAVSTSGSRMVSPDTTTTYTLAARDEAGLTDQQQVTVSVIVRDASRHEAEAAALAGVTIQTDLPGASGGAYVKMEDTGSITWTVGTSAAGAYVLTFGYYLPFEFKAQFLDVNGVRVDTVEFNTPTNQFLSTEVPATLQAGSNTIALSEFYGYMNFDYLSVRPAGDVAAEDDANAAAFGLAANRPNPFGSATTIAYTLSRAEEVRLEVFDLMGRRVTVLVEDWQMAGPHEVRFEALGLPSGTYLYRLSAGGAVQTRRMQILR